MNMKNEKTNSATLAEVVNKLQTIAALAIPSSIKLANDKATKDASIAKIKNNSIYKNLDANEKGIADNFLIIDNAEVNISPSGNKITFIKVDGNIYKLILLLEKDNFR